MGTLRRSGPWTVSSRIRVQSVMGSVILDFCDTTVPPAVDIALELGAGSARLLLPDGASADVDGMMSGMGTVRSKVASTAGARAAALPRARPERDGIGDGALPVPGGGPPILKARVGDGGIRRGHDPAVAPSSSLKSVL